ncbi:MAG: SPASM domain-containing protein [Lachnospiraceae bacterium]|nr:SPASM domain-containing protein [Lachnospiraceae bacterium]
MPIKINSFGGPIVWFFRKYCSAYTSKIALEFTAKKYAKVIDDYIHSFITDKQPPIFKMVNIETVNRCNGTCAFCPANVRDERRERKVMAQELFEKIILELKTINWRGQIFLNINNEPLLDKHIEERARFIKDQLGDHVIISMFTNGSLLTPKRLTKLKWGGVDELIINNYSKSYRLNSQQKKIYQYVKSNPDPFKKMKIVINRRYSEEILATRAGLAPNKKKRNNKVFESCIYPYTDITIFPDGKVGLCCNDCYEVTDYGNVSKQTLVEIWESPQFIDLRKEMQKGRLAVPFCVECDVVDSGFREQLIKKSNEVLFSEK